MHCHLITIYGDCPEIITGSQSFQQIVMQPVLPADVWLQPQPEFSWVPWPEKMPASADVWPQEQLSEKAPATLLPVVITPAAEEQFRQPS